MPSNLLATKLYQPAPPAQRVQRPYLVQCLNEGLVAGRRLTLVSAPAGFGKTTCVSEWLSGLGRPVGWLSLEPADDDPGRFFAYLVAALQRVDEAIGRELQGIGQQGQLPPVESLVTTLLNDILGMDHPFLLVLDDFQSIRDHVILKGLERLVANQPAAMHLVLVTREDPPLPLARLRANNQLTEVRAEELRFTVQEANSFLNGLMELALSEADIAALESRTEGWAVGLQLAGLSIRGRANPSAFIAGLSGSHRYILSYLTEQVLDRQTEEVTAFLLQTSILSKVSGELADAVTGRENSTALLEKLLAANLFLIPLDDEQHWYRYHHLFADLLAGRLRQAFPAEAIQELHARACTWLAQNGYLDEAIRHALEGKDYTRAAALVEQVARTTMFTGQINTLRNWLAAFPESSFSIYPRLTMYRLWIDLLQGRVGLSEQDMQEKEELLRALPSSPENDSLRVELMVMLSRFLALLGDPTRAIHFAEETLGYLSPEDLAARARVLSALAIAHGIQGESDKAEPAYRESLRLAHATDNYSLAAHTTLIMGLGLSHYGRLREAARSFQSIVELGTRVGQPTLYPAGQGYIGLAGVYLEWNEVEKAQGYLQQGMGLCFQGGLDGLYAGQLIQARLHQAQGNLQAAWEDVGLLEQRFPRTDHQVRARQIQLRLATGELAEAARLAAPWMGLLDADPAAVRLPLIVLEDLEAILIRVLLAQGDTERALHSLDVLQATAEPGRRSGHLLEVHLLRALAFHKQHGDRVTAPVLESFERALSLAEPEGHVLLFLEEGPALIPLLESVARRAAAPEPIRKYAQNLLPVFHSRASTSPAPVLGGPVEPLSQRELEVLRLLAEGLTYDQVARRLVISVNTVRFHVKSIYSKLDVENRVAAIERARGMSLL